MRIALSTASESSMVMELETGIPNNVTVSFPWIMAITRDFRSCCKRSKIWLRAATTPEDPRLDSKRVIARTTQNTALAMFATQSGHELCCVMAPARSGAVLPEFSVDIRITSESASTLRADVQVER